MVPFSAATWWLPYSVTVVFASFGSAQFSELRSLQPGEVSSGFAEYDVDGIAGYTTWELYIELSGQCANAYAFAGNADEGHPTTIPGGYQADAPFDSNIGGIRPAYWPFNHEAQYDSWVTGKNHRISTANYSVTSLSLPLVIQAFHASPCSWRCEWYR